MKKLSVDRMEELQKILEEEKSEILKLEEETELLSSDDITEEQLQKILRVSWVECSGHSCLVFLYRRLRQRKLKRI